MNLSDFKILAANTGHLSGLVACHQSAFPGEFLTLLGPRFLRSFYKYYCNHPDAICLVAQDVQSEFIGGLVFGGAPHVRSQFMKKYIPLFLPIILLKSLFNKRVRERLLEHGADLFNSIAVKLNIKKNAIVNMPPADPPGTWSSLLSICTHQNYRGRGAAGALMEAFRFESKKRGYRTMRLSVHNNNTAAIELYKKSGWEIVFKNPKGTYFKRAVGN